MDRKRKIALRIFATIAAIGFGIAIVIGLTYVGDKSQGPLEDAMQQVSENVTQIENAIVQNAREETRQEALSWFNGYRNKPEKMLRYRNLLWGAYDNDTKSGFEKIVSLEDSLQIKFPIIQLYVAWGSKSEQKFPFNKAKAIYDLGSIPFITWEPWLNDFDGEANPTLPPPEYRASGCLLAIAKGDYDFYLDEWIKEVKRFGAPLFIRFGHEMNDPYRYPWGPQNNKSAEFIDAWKHVVLRFKNSGATNVIWMWSPHPAYTNYNEYYPGDSLVDWIGIPALNYGTVASWSQWWTFSQIFGNYYPQLSSFKKPIMITEFASLGIGGNRAQWYKDAIVSFKKYPLLKSVIFFHSGDDNTTTYKSLNWQIVQDKAVINKIKPLIK